MNDAKLGLFICDCGGAISNVLDVACLEARGRELPGVAVAQRLNYSCSPDGIETIAAACADHSLDRVVVAGCTPRLMSRHLQRNLPVAADLVELADIREGCAWVHGDEPEQATAKALDAIAMASARLALRQPRQPVSGEVAPAALVIGGGVAGLTAALTLANAGQPVVLVERGAALGGSLTDAQRRNGWGGRIEQVSRHPRIEVALNSQVSDVSGTVGRYTVSLGDKQFDVGAIIVAIGEPAAAQPGAGVLAHLLGLHQDQDGYFPEVRYRLRPEGYAERGIYVCGAAHHPVDPREAEIEAISAAFKALRHLRAGQVVNQAPVARVDPALCTGCANCVEPCPFEAIAMQPRAEAVDLARIDPLLCTGCGNCVVVCPVKAISQPIDNDAQVLAQIEAALGRTNGKNPSGLDHVAHDRFDTTSPEGFAEERVRILVFGCEWSGHAAAELAGANKLSYPVETRLIRLRCSARFDPIHILWALYNGADGVFLGACAPGDCHYIDGNRYAQERIATLSKLLAANGFDPRRLRLAWITPDDPRDFVRQVSGFTELVAKL